VKIIKLEESNYPKNLKEIDAPPTELFIKGEMKKSDEYAVAIVGSRQMSLTGKNIATWFAKELVKSNITLISGLARGIDTVVHKTALYYGGRTIGVLGSGFNHFYPPENKELASLIEQRGAVVTEFTPNMPPLGKNFLIRNRIISGLSLAVIVIEGKRRSGTLSTATHAANQSREVFAVPGSELPDYLIENGANIATSPQVILDYLGSLP
jgi:DNA processing protein